MDSDRQVPVELVNLFNLYNSERLPRSLASDQVDPISGVHYKDVTINAGTNVSARLYLPQSYENKKLPVLIYIHGGGFLAGSAYIPMYHNYLISLVSRANVLAVSVEYRLAPQHRFPAPYDDAFTAFEWVASRDDPWLAEHGDFDRTFIAGDSAGANITHDLTLRLGREGVKVQGMVLMHPYFWGSERIDSEINDPLIRLVMNQAWGLAKSPDMTLDHPNINPVAEGAPSLGWLGCKKAMVLLAQMDPWIFRGRAYHRALKESGFEGEETMFETKGSAAMHGFFLAYPEWEISKEVMEKMVAFINPVC